MESFSLGNIFLNKGEFRTLAAVMDNLDFLFGRNEQFNDILLKFEASEERDKAVKDRLNINMSHFGMEEELKEYLYMMNRAIEESRVLELEYINRRLVREKREVLPYYIDFSSGNWYLVGFCKARNAFRRFKLVRIKGMKPGVCFEKQEVSIEDIRREFDKEYRSKSIKVVLSFDGRMGEQLSEYFPKENIRAAEDGSYIAEDFFPYEEGLVKYLLGFGKDCKVLEPEYLKKEIKAYMEEILAKYNS